MTVATATQQDVNFYSNYSEHYAAWATDAAAPTGGSTKAATATETQELLPAGMPAIFSEDTMARAEQLNPFSNKAIYSLSRAPELPEANPADQAIIRQGLASSLAYSKV